MGITGRDVVAESGGKGSSIFCIISFSPFFFILYRIDFLFAFLVNFKQCFLTILLNDFSS